MFFNKQDNAFVLEATTKPTKEVKLVLKYNTGTSVAATTVTYAVNDEISVEPTIDSKQAWNVAATYKISKQDSAKATYNSKSEAAVEFSHTEGPAKARSIFIPAACPSISASRPTVKVLISFITDPIAPYLAEFNKLSTSCDLTFSIICAGDPEAAGEGPEEPGGQRHHRCGEGLGPLGRFRSCPSASGSTREEPAAERVRGAHLRRA